MSSDTQAPESAGQPTDSSLPAQPPSTEPTSTESAPAELATTEVATTVAPAEAPTMATPTMASVGDDSGSPSSEANVVPATERPSERIQIGTQRETDAADKAEAKPVTPGSSTPQEPEPTKSNYPPPNVRDQLSPELEKELEAALGGESLDDIIDSSTTAAATGEELPPDTKITGTVAKIHRERRHFHRARRSQPRLATAQAI